MKQTVRLPLFFLCCGIIQEKRIPSNIIPGHVFPLGMTTINIYGEYISLKYLFLKLRRKEGKWLYLKT